MGKCDLLKATKQPGLKPGTRWSVVRNANNCASPSHFSRYIYRNCIYSKKKLMQDHKRSKKLSQKHETKWLRKQLQYAGEHQGKTFNNCTRTKSDDEEEWFCFFCIEPYSNKLPGENWIQCYGCKGWAHDACTGILRNQMYMCQKLRI